MGTGAVSRYKLSWSQRFYHGAELLITCRCANPDATHYKFVPGAEKCKKYDKQLTHIVRVRFSVACLLLSRLKFALLMSCLAD